ncbi:MAG: SRPBCC family protein [Pseudomonadota bacterium]|nr:SRPBCC family protein [Pseudomonadota bacterium]
MASTDEIRKQLHIKAPQSRVWRAITDPEQFGAWFRVRLETPFVAGQPTSGQITYPGWEHVRFTLVTDAIEPETRFAYLWHPYAVDVNKDYSAEPMTRVEFLLQPQDGGTLVTIVESGFDRLPPERIEEAFRMNERGWAEQLNNIQAYVAG